MRYLGTSLLIAAAIMASPVSNAVAAEPVVLSAAPSASADLDRALDAVAPGIAKWAVVCVARKGDDGRHIFEWIDYADTGTRTDFWPASTIKLYAVIAALELLNEKGFGLDTVVQFEHRSEDAWVLDCARSIREMISEVSGARQMRITRCSCGWSESIASTRSSWLRSEASLIRH